MSLPNNTASSSSTIQLVRLSLLVGLGLILFLFESLIPRPLPWLKPGLAHIATLIAIYLMNNRAAMLVVVVRVLVGSLLLGSLFNPTFVLSLGGGIAATFVMAMTHHYLPRTFSIFGISILGAVVHNLVQLLLVQILIVHRLEVLYLAPFMILSSLFTGFIVGLISYLLIQRIQLVVHFD